MKIMMVDLDGTLFDTKRTNWLAYQEAMKSYGFSIDYQYYCDYCNGRHYTDFLPQITTDDAKVLQDIHDRKKQLYKNYLGEARINQLLVDLLIVSKQTYKIALVTTASRVNTEDILKKFDVEGIFDLILTHEDISKSKPDPEGYLLAMKKFDATPEESIIFEDSDVGIQAAEATGALCLVVKGYN